MGQTQTNSQCAKRLRSSRLARAGDGGAMAERWRALAAGAPRQSADAEKRHAMQQAGAQQRRAQRKQRYGHPDERHNPPAAAGERAAGERKLCTAAAATRAEPKGEAYRSCGGQPGLGNSPTPAGFGNSRKPAGFSKACLLRKQRNAARVVRVPRPSQSRVRCVAEQGSPDRWGPGSGVRSCTARAASVRRQASGQYQQGPAGALGPHQGVLLACSMNQLSNMRCGSFDRLGTSSHSW